LRENWHANRIEEPKATWREVVLHPQSTFRARKCLEISGTERREAEVDVAVEENLAVILNGEFITALAALPVQFNELAIGFLIDEGLAKSLQDIASVKEENGVLVCETREGTAGRWADQQCCSQGSSSFPDLMPVRGGLRMKASAILKAVAQLNQEAKLWRRTGATHTSMICSSEGEILASCEDVSRASSVDKAVGTALLAGYDLSSCALITSGRLSGVMVAKAARAGFPVLVSRSAPMDSGVELAQKIGMTLVGFARSPNLYVYSGFERII